MYNAHNFSYDKNIFVKWPGTLCKESNNLVRNYKLHTFTDLQQLLADETLQSSI